MKQELGRICPRKALSARKRRPCASYASINWVRFKGSQRRSGLPLCHLPLSPIGGTPLTLAKDRGEHSDGQSSKCVANILKNGASGPKRIGMGGGPRIRPTCPYLEPAIPCRLVDRTIPRRSPGPPWTFAEPPHYRSMLAWPCFQPGASLFLLKSGARLCGRDNREHGAKP